MRLRLHSFAVSMVNVALLLTALAARTASAVEARALPPLVRGESIDVALLTGVYFSAGSERYIELKDEAAKLLVERVRIEMGEGLDVELLAIDAYPSRLTFSSSQDPSAIITVNGFKISSRVRVRAGEEASPGEKVVNLELPTVAFAAETTKTVPVWTDGHGLPRNPERKASEIENDPKNGRLKQRGLSFGVRVYRDAAERSADFRARRIAEAKQHQVGDVVSGILGLALGIGLLLGLFLSSRAARREVTLKSAAVHIGACFLGAALLLGGVSRLHSVITGYGNESTLFQLQAIRWPPGWLAYVVMTYVIVTLLAWIKLSDGWGWQKAISEATPKSLQSYRRAHPLGRHREEAAQLIAGIVQGVWNRLAAASVFGDERWNILFLLVSHIREQQLYLEPFPVFVDYASSFRSMVAELRAHHPGMNILEASAAFSTEKNGVREGQITDLVRAAFERVIPPGLVTFAPYRRARSGARLHTEYVIHTSGALYYSESQKSKPDMERDYFEGVGIAWLCRFSITGGGDYAFELRSAPESLITVVVSSDWSGPQASQVYDAMAASAFRDFSQGLARHFCLDLDVQDAPRGQPLPVSAT